MIFHTAESAEKSGLPGFGVTPQRCNLTRLYPLCRSNRRRRKASENSRFPGRLCRPVWPGAGVRTRPLSCFRIPRPVGAVSSPKGQIAQALGNGLLCQQRRTSRAAVPRRLFDAVILSGAKRSRRIRISGSVSVCMKRRERILHCVQNDRDGTFFRSRNAVRQRLRCPGGAGFHPAREKPTRGHNGAVVRRCGALGKPRLKSSYVLQSPLLCDKLQSYEVTVASPKGVTPEATCSRASYIFCIKKKCCCRCGGMLFFGGPGGTALDF